MIIRNVDKYIALLQNELLIELNRTFSPKITDLYIQKITDNIITKIPNNLFERISYYICLNIKDLFLLVIPNTDIQQYREIICNLIKTLPKQLHNILTNQQHNVDKIIFDFMEDISKNNVALDSALRLSEFLRNFLYQKSNSFVSLVLNNNDLVNEIKSFNNDVKIEYPTAQLVCPEYYQALEKICAYMCAVVQLTIVKTISESSGTNNSRLSISVEKKKK